MKLTAGWVPGLSNRWMNLDSLTCLLTTKFEFNFSVPNLSDKSRDLFSICFVGSTVSTDCRMHCRATGVTTDREVKLCEAYE